MQSNGHKDNYNITSIHTATRQLWKLEKTTLDRVEQADHIIIVVNAVFTYRLH